MALANWLPVQWHTRLRKCPEVPGVNHVTSLPDGNLEVVRPATDISKGSLKRPKTQLACLFIVLCSTVLSISAIVLGCLIRYHLQPIPAFMKDIYMVRSMFGSPTVGLTRYVHNHYAIPSTKYATELVTLASNLALTGILSVHGKVASVALLWFLEEEDNDRPRFNTNPRFLKGTEAVGPCHCFVNVVSAACTAISYGAIATLVSKISILGTPIPDGGDIAEGVYPGAGYGLDFSAYPLIMLGSALLLQSFISVWIFLAIWLSSRERVKTWSSNPVVNVIYIIIWAPSARWRTAKIGSDPVPNRQSAGEQVRRLRVFSRIVWSSFAGLVLASIVTAIYAARAGSFRFGEDDFGEHEIWEDFGLVYTVFGQGSATSDWAGPLLQSLMQGYFAFVLHCADTAISFLNDEHDWQHAYQRYKDKPNVFMPSRWHIRWWSLLFIVMNAGIQTVFSYAVSVDAAITVSFIPLIVVTVLMLITASLLEIVLRMRPKRGGPTTYGELDLLFRYISKHHLLWLGEA